jgi:hypothetical protein
MAAGCGDDAGAPDAYADAAPDAISDAMTGRADLPARPADIVFTCPDGFRAVAHASGASVCDPWPESGRAECTGDALHVPGTPGCAPVGAPCPGGDYAEGLPAAGVWYVLAGAPAGGDGSISAPFGSIGTALGPASTGDTIAIGKGRYDEALRIDRGVVLRGACASETTLTVTSSTTTSATIEARATGVEIHDLTIADSEIVGFRVTATGEAMLEGVVIDGATGAGLAAEASGSVVGRRVVVRNGRPLSDGTAGRGLNVHSGAAVTLTEAEIANNHDVGIFALGAGSTVTLDRVAVHDTLTQPADRRWGLGLLTQDGAAIEATACAIEDNRELAVGANENDARVSLTDCVVRRTMPRESDDEAGRALTLAGASSGSLTRVLIEDNHDVGIAAIRGAALTVEDVVLSGVRAAPGNPELGRGVDFQLGASLRGRRFVVHDTVDGGFDAFDPDTLIELEDVVVRDVAPNVDGLFGRGISAELAAVVRMERVHVERVHAIALFASAATLELTDLTVRDVESEQARGRAGRALAAQDGATVALTRACFERTREVAISAHHEGTRVDGEHVTIRDVRERACASDACADNPGGMGLGATDSAAIELSDFEVETAPLCGVQVAVGGSVDLHRGVIRGCGIGACIQESDYDATRLQDDVTYVDNGTNLDTVELPVFDAADSHVSF